MMMLGRFRAFSTVAAKLKSTNSNSTSKHPYRDVFRWGNERELAKILNENIVYDEHELVGILKPLGVGIYKPQSSMPLTEKNITSLIPGEPRHCIVDVLDLVGRRSSTTASIEEARHLSIARACPRHYSGLVLLSSNPEFHKEEIERSIRRARASLVPYMRFYCIVNGIISNGSDQPITERCAMRLVGLDDQDTIKEPRYISPEHLTKGVKRVGRYQRPFIDNDRCRPVLVRYRTLSTNTKLSVSLVELECNATRWSFIECFLAYKASFVLGDTYFSQRVKHILGNPIIMTKSVPTSNAKRLIDTNFEPLSEQVRRRLQVHRNAEIPLMVHHCGIHLPGLRKILANKESGNKESGNKTLVSTSPDNNDLIIYANNYEQLPRHFQYTLDRLDLNVFPINK